MATTYQEISIPLKGLTLAAKVWGQHGIPTIALHGWLDNAASFDLLAPLLKKCHIVALDMPGHGLSDHQPPSANLHILDLATTTIMVANHFGWHKFALLGHSLGAAICGLIAGTIQERILWAVLCDSIGPITSPAEHAPMQYRLFINESLSKVHKGATPYDTKDQALQARLKVNTMQENSAKILLNRGLKQLPGGKWRWRTDPRLLMPLAQYLTEEQVIAYIRAITAPTCVIKPNPGFPFPEELFQRRFNALAQKQLFRIQGGHHVHLDNPQLVADCINPFIENCG